MPIKKSNPHKCPICRKTEFSHFHSFEVCDVCGWTDDGYQEENPDEDCLGNTMSLNEARKTYEKGLKID